MTIYFDESQIPESPEEPDPEYPEFEEPKTIPLGEIVNSNNVFSYKSFFTEDMIPESPESPDPEYPEFVEPKTIPLEKIAAFPLKQEPENVSFDKPLSPTRYF